MKIKDKNKYKKDKNYTKKLLAIIIGIIMLLSLIPYFLMGW